MIVVPGQPDVAERRRLDAAVEIEPEDGERPDRDDVIGVFDRPDRLLLADP